MSKLIDITDMSDAELDTLIGMHESEPTICRVVTAPGPRRVVTTTHYSDGSFVEHVKRHGDGYETTTRYTAKGT